MTLHPQRRTRVLLALLSDIHANRQAFAACLEAARAQGAERLVLLGDLVGYGGDPEWVVDTAMALVEQGAIAVRGNHDSAIAHSESMNPAARAAIDWTRERLSATQRDFLAGRPMTPQSVCLRPQRRSPSAVTSTSPCSIRCPRPAR
jgi:hypothetical protein